MGRSDGGGREKRRGKEKRKSDSPNSWKTVSPSPRRLPTIPSTTLTSLISILGPISIRRTARWVPFLFVGQRRKKTQERKYGEVSFGFELSSNETSGRRETKSKKERRTCFPVQHNPPAAQPSNSLDPPHRFPHPPSHSLPPSHSPSRTLPDSHSYCFLQHPSLARGSRRYPDRLRGRRVS